MGSGISGQAYDVKKDDLWEMPSGERKLSIKFPSNFNLTAFHKFRDTKLKDIDGVEGLGAHTNGESSSGRGEREMETPKDVQDTTGTPTKATSVIEDTDVRPGIYTTVYSYYHWKNKYVN